MILQGSLRMEYNGQSFSLIVKTFLKNNVYYFFVSDKERDNTLLSGETLELTYTDSFCAGDVDFGAENKKIPTEIVDAVESMLLKNKQLWFY